MVTLRRLGYQKVRTCRVVVAAPYSRGTGGRMIRLNVNGKEQTVEVEPDTPLLWVLRDELGLTGTKYGCGMALCGACTVHVDGNAIRSCVTPVSAVPGKKVPPLEGLALNTRPAVPGAWGAGDAPQMGDRQAGRARGPASPPAENP